MKKIFLTFLFCLVTGIASASLLITGDLIIKFNSGQPSESVDIGAILQEEGGQILQEEGGVILYD